MGPSRRSVLIAAAGCVGPVAFAQASPPPEVSSALPEARLQGSGRLRFLGLAIYDARLWTTTAFTADQFTTHPFALELIYQRALVGKLIAERSLDEMRKVGTPTEAQSERWLAAMVQTFPDVKSGDRITGLHRDGRTRFFVNGQPRGEAVAALREPEFARLFFGIWLSPRTSEPSLRRALIGA
jgi:hypothetical protein